MFDRIQSARNFSRLELKTGAQQIRLRQSDIEKTAFNTKYGQFECLMMPMGACNAPATFQILVNDRCHDCIDKFICVYVDKQIILSKFEKSRLRHLEIVFSMLKERELYVSPKKRAPFQEGMDFLGLMIGKHGIRVNPRKVGVLRM